MEFAHVRHAVDFRPLGYTADPNGLLGARFREDRQVPLERVVASSAGIDASAARGGDSPFDPKTVAILRVEMLRFARFNRGSTDACETVVQKALEGAVRNASTFRGQSTLDTWVCSILRHRIVDHLRRGPGAVPISTLVDDDADWQQRVASLFTRNGHWLPDTKPSAWPDPEDAAESEQFWAALEVWMEVLPGRAGRVFIFRAVLGLESDEICQRLGITVANLHVIFHRARLKLRECLENGWVRAGGKTC